jgi:hypothetical protein
MDGRVCFNNEGCQFSCDDRSLMKQKISGVCARNFGGYRAPFEGVSDVPGGHCGTQTYTFHCNVYQRLFSLVTAARLGQWGFSQCEKNFEVRRGVVLYLGSYTASPSFTTALGRIETSGNSCREWTSKKGQSGTQRNLSIEPTSLVGTIVDAFRIFRQ